MLHSTISRREYSLIQCQYSFFYRINTILQAALRLPSLSFHSPIQDVKKLNTIDGFRSAIVHRLEKFQQESEIPLNVFGKLCTENAMVNKYISILKHSKTAHEIKDIIYHLSAEFEKISYDESMLEEDIYIPLHFYTNKNPKLKQTIDDLFSMINNSQMIETERKKACRAAFFQGSHPRLGQYSSLQFLYRSPIFDKNVLQIIFEMGEIARNKKPLFSTKDRTKIL